MVDFGGAIDRFSGPEMTGLDSREGGELTTGDDIHDDGDEERKWCVRVPSRDRLKGSGTVLPLRYMVYM